MYDGIDLDEILTNDRLLAGYVNCLLEKGPCTPDGKELKSKIYYYFCYLYCIACTHKLRHRKIYNRNDAMLLFNMQVSSRDYFMLNTG